MCYLNRKLLRLSVMILFFVAPYLSIAPCISDAISEREIFNMNECGLRRFLHQRTLSVLRSIASDAMQWVKEGEFRTSGVHIEP